MAKNKDYIALINTTRWRRLRVAKLSANPLCERCAANGRVTAATEVHHIQPIEDAFARADMERLAYDRNNLLALCHDCHIAIHQAMGRSGKEHAKRHNAEQLAQFKKKFL